VPTGAHRYAADLAYPQTAPARPEIGRDLVQFDDAVRQALEFEAAVGIPRRRAIVEQEDGTAALGEELLQPDHLAAIAMRRPREQAKFRQGVDHHPLGLDAVDALEDLRHHFRKIDLGGLKDRLLLAPRVRHGVHLDVDAVEGPAVGRGPRSQFLFGFS